MSTKSRVAVLLCFLLLGRPWALYGQQVELSLLPTPELIGVDSVVMIVLHIGPVEHLHAYSVDIAYDTARVRYQSLQRIPFFKATTFFAFNVDSTAGKIILNEAILGPAGQSGEGGLALMRFVGVRPGVAHFQITASSLRDTVNVTIPASNGGASVAVGSPDYIQGKLKRDQSPVLRVTNYPNPFNDATMIVYSLLAPSDVRVDLVNVLGERIRTLSAMQVDAGEHAFRWDGRDDNGQPVPSGTIFARFETGAASVTKKLLLLR